MTTNERKDAYEDNGVVNGNGNGNCLGQDPDKMADSNLEVNPPKSEDSTKKDHPFGNETNSEIKYRTLTWWLVASLKFPSMTRLIASSQAMWNAYAVEAEIRKTTPY